MSPLGIVYATVPHGVPSHHQTSSDVFGCGDSSQRLHPPSHTHTSPHSSPSALTMPCWLCLRIPHPSILCFTATAPGQLWRPVSSDANVTSSCQPSWALVLRFRAWAQAVLPSGTNAWAHARPPTVPLPPSPPPSQAAHAAKLFSGKHWHQRTALSPAHVDLAGLPPVHVEMGQCEVLRDQQRELCDRARRAGVAVTQHEAPYMVHAFPLFSFAADRDAAPQFEPLLALDRVAEFLTGQVAEAELQGASAGAPNAPWRQSVARFLRPHNAS